MSRATPAPLGDDPTAPRRAGVLLPVGSLPGGCLGPPAFAFVDWLADAGQAWWQVLPITPPDRYGSPYASPSAFASWPGYLAAPRTAVSAAEISEFRERNGYWIDDWARAAGPGALEDQVRTDREWRRLRDHAASRGVRILGDLPFYVAPRGADVRAHPGLFRSDLVAGVPPDAFTADGQLWGNPTYDWAAMRAEGYRWWTERLRRSRELFDSLRIDHFRAFVSWWAVPRGARTARSGTWRRGPGAAVIDTARAHLGSLSLVAEDLGVITPAVHALMERLGLPGTRVIQFAFEGSAGNAHRLGNHVRHAVVYSGTHDNQTAAGWWEAASEVTRQEALAAAAEAGIAGEPPHRLIARLALSSPAGLAIVPAQDLLGLGDEARLNTPGTRHGNWSWRLRDGQLTPEGAAWLRQATEAAGRLPHAPPVSPAPPSPPDPVAPST